MDDEKDTTDSARDVIQMMVPHCRVETADSCAHGLDAVSRGSFDAVLVDYRMPERNGLEFIRQMHGLQPDVPAILMTAYGSIEVASEAINDCHVDGFLAKPLDAMRLAETVEGAIRRSFATPEPVIRW
ncbi:MAG: response regulator [Thermoplasmatota archaeon]